MAADWATNPVDGSASTNPYPMRPVCQIQTRTALANPGYPDYGASTAPVTGPNVWSGGTEWSVFADRCFGSYVGSLQGDRLEPATGQFGTVPYSPYSYSTTDYVPSLAIGGGLPTLFDGSGVFEQSFLYFPESVAVSLGTSQDTGPTWNSALDSYSWIFTYEFFDATGTFHISSRSAPVTLTANTVGWSSSPVTLNPTFYIPTLGPTMKQYPANMSSAFMSSVPMPGYGPVTIGCYRTTNGGSNYYRLYDVYFNGGIDSNGNVSVTNDWTSLAGFGSSARRGTVVTVTDTVPDGIAQSQGVIGTAGLQDGTHPVLYGDGTNGAPGSLDNLCPPATPVMCRHQERLFVARGNQVLFSKQRAEFVGPGFNEVVNVFFVGGDDPILGMESLDNNLIVFKSQEIYAIGGNGPADDGSGNGYNPPQRIPTETGCVDGRSVKATPDGVYFQSTEGLKVLSRNLAVSYVGGPVVDELATYPFVKSVTFHPQQRRLYFVVGHNDFQVPSAGEILVKQYEFNSWTTHVLKDGSSLKGFVGSTLALATRSTYETGIPTPVLHLMDASGVIWRENDPSGSTPYYDNTTYVQSSWTSPWIKPASTSNGLGNGGLQNWSRVYQTMVIGNSVTPHGVNVSYSVDYANLANTITWTWNTTGTSQISPGGVPWTPITQLSSYVGSRGESFQFQVVDINDPSSTTGQGMQLLGMTLTIGTYDGPYRIPQGARQ